MCSSCSEKLRTVGMGLKPYLSSGKSSAMAISFRPTSFHWLSSSAELAGASFFEDLAACRTDTSPKTSAKPMSRIAQRRQPIICVPFLRVHEEPPFASDARATTAFQPINFDGAAKAASRPTSTPDRKVADNYEYEGPRPGQFDLRDAAAQGSSGAAGGRLCARRHPWPRARRLRRGYGRCAATGVGTLLRRDWSRRTVWSDSGSARRDEGRGGDVSFGRGVFRRTS